MIDQILERDSIGNKKYIDRNSKCWYKPRWAIAEMKAQIGYSHFLKKIGKTASDSFETCQKLYQKAREVAIKLGEDVTNFPKTIRT